MVLHQMFTVRGLTWYCGGTLWTATFYEQRLCENFDKRQSDSGPVWTFISGSLPDTEPVDVQGKFN